MGAALIQRQDRLEEAAATATVATFVGGVALSLLALNAAAVVPDALLRRRCSFLTNVVDPSTRSAGAIAALFVGMGHTAPILEIPRRIRDVDQTAALNHLAPAVSENRNGAALARGVATENKTFAGVISGLFSRRARSTSSIAGSDGAVTFSAAPLAAQSRSESPGMDLLRNRRPADQAWSVDLRPQMANIEGSFGPPSFNQRPCSRANCRALASRAVPRESVALARRGFPRIERPNCIFAHLTELDFNQGAPIGFLR